MINPSDINLSALPWVPLDATAGFPAQPGIYFAIDSLNKVQYIGRSGNVRGRWKSHHRYDALAAIGGVRIVYLFVDESSLLPAIEEALIDWFDPPLNVARPTSPIKVKRSSKDYRVKAGAWGESKQRVQIMLTPTAIERVDAIAEGMQLTRAEVIERLIRSPCLNTETLLSIDGGEIDD